MSTQKTTGSAVPSKQDQQKHANPGQKDGQQKHANPGQKDHNKPEQQAPSKKA